MFQTTDNKFEIPLTSADNVLDAISNFPKKLIDMPKIYLFYIHSTLRYTFNQLLHARSMSKVANSILTMNAYLYILIFPLILLF